MPRRRTQKRKTTTRRTRRTTHTRRGFLTHLAMQPQTSGFSHNGLPSTESWSKLQKGWKR